MKSDEFELAFSSYIESKACDEAEDALFAAMRTAFCAGWAAARGEQPVESDKVIYLLRKD